MSLVVLGIGRPDCAAQVESGRARSIVTSELVERLGQSGWLIVDVRDSNAFNGWIVGQQKRGGHIRGATNLALRWMETYEEEAIRLVESKGFRGNQIVLYGNSASDANRMASWLRNRAQLSPDQLFVYAEGIVAWSRDNTLPMDRLPRYEKLVPPQWVHQLIEEGNSDDYRIVEVNWRKNTSPFGMDY